MWVCEKRYRLGVPFSEAGARAFKQAIDERNAVTAENDKEPPPDKRFAAAFIIDNTNALITSKAVGLLQADSILTHCALGKGRTNIQGPRTKLLPLDVCSAMSGGLFLRGADLVRSGVCDGCRHDGLGSVGGVNA